MPALNIRNVNIHYRVFGERGPWLALITGGRRGFAEFVPLAGKIAAHGVRVLLHDRRNTGASDVVIDGTAVAQVKAGRLKAIAVTGPRLPALPEVPGIGETIKGYSFTNWWGILAPAGAPDGVVNRLSEEFSAIAAQPDIRQRLSDLGLAAQGSTPRQLAEHIRGETEKVARIVKDAGIRFE